MFSVQSALQSAEHQNNLLQRSQTQLSVTQASLEEAKEHIAALQSEAAGMAASLSSSQTEVETLKLQLADALNRAHLSESHAAQMRHITEHLQSSVSQQVT